MEVRSLCFISMGRALRKLPRRNRGNVAASGHPLLCNIIAQSLDPTCFAYHSADLPSWSNLLTSAPYCKMKYNTCKLGKLTILWLAANQHTWLLQGWNMPYNRLVPSLGPIHQTNGIEKPCMQRFTKNNIIYMYHQHFNISDCLIKKI